METAGSLDLGRTEQVGTPENDHQHWESLVASGKPLTMPDLEAMDVNTPSHFVLFDPPTQTFKKIISEPPWREDIELNMKDVNGVLRYHELGGYEVNVCVGLHDDFLALPTEGRVQSSFKITDEERLRDLNIRAKKIV